MISSPSPAAYKAVLMTPPKSHLQLWVVADGLSCRERTQGQDGMGGGGLATTPAVLQLPGQREHSSYPKEKHSARPKTAFQHTSISQKRKRRFVCSTPRSALKFCKRPQRSGTGREEVARGSGRAGGKSPLARLAAVSFEPTAMPCCRTAGL